MAGRSRRRPFWLGGNILWISHLASVPLICTPKPFISIRSLVVRSAPDQAEIGVRVDYAAQNTVEMQSYRGQGAVAKRGDFDA